MPRGCPPWPRESPAGRASLLSGAREQNAAGLERLARRIEPAVGWPDLVLPAAVTGQLRELAARARHRDQVLTDWRMRPGGGRGRGITALFAGDSGTGKTMSAEVIAGELGLDLYTIDLATVVDKYVGETEKNLERIFAEAGGVNAVLLFDEADAVFGKRSEVRDAHDRYANIESAYLLQRMESFDGLAVLATNLRANIDDAFTRRLDAIVDFPVPDADLRRALWDQCLGPYLPRGEDMDLDFCARAFEFSGGAIRSVVVTAAYLAADKAGPVGHGRTHHRRAARVPEAGPAAAGAGVRPVLRARPLTVRAGNPARKCARLTRARSAARWHCGIVGQGPGGPPCAHTSTTTTGQHRCDPDRHASTTRTRGSPAQAAAAGRWDAVGAGGILDLQRSAGNQGVAAALQDEEPSPVHDVVNSGAGQPLDPGVRADMEARLGHDFGDVRVHHDARAEESASAVNAHAYTVGSNIVFQRDRYDPSSDAGRVTLAHELTHVIQQRSGPVDGTAAPGGIRLSNPSDRFEREAAANAERVMNTPAPAPAAALGPEAPGIATAVQRQEEEQEEEEPTAQGTFVQRVEEEEEEES